MNAITRETTVKEAVTSCKIARELFIQHGIDPMDRCVGMYDLNTLGDAQDWCHVQDVDALIRELNAAIVAEQRSSTEAHL